MVNQTTVNKPPPPHASASVSHAAAGVIEIGELSFQLIARDARAAWKPTRAAALGVAMAVGLWLAAAPVLLASVAASLYAGAGLSVAASLAVTGGSAAMLAGIGLWWARANLIRAWSVAIRSNSELKENVQWFKELL
jgi:cytochrome c biogenesis protein CcdA